MATTHMTDSSDSQPMKVLVTGAASGIGQEVAAHFVRSGLDVLACDRNEIVLPDPPGNDASRSVSYLFDQSSRQACAEFETAVDQEGWRFSSAVLCAGFTRHLSVMETSREEFDEIVAGNFAGTFELLKIAARNMIKNHTQGSIVVVSSINAEGPLASQAVYSASKAAISSLAISAALELAPHGIRVNIIAPGAILSGMTSPFDASGIPLQRVGDPADIAGAAAFLIGESSSYMTGSTVTVDGGMIRVR